MKQDRDSAEDEATGTVKINTAGGEGYGIANCELRIANANAELRMASQTAEPPQVSRA